MMQKESWELSFWRKQASNKNAPRTPAQWRNALFVFLASDASLSPIDAATIRLLHVTHLVAHRNLHPNRLSFMPSRFRPSLPRNAREYFSGFGPLVQRARFQARVARMPDPQELTCTRHSILRAGIAFAANVQE